VKSHLRILHVEDSAFDAELARTRLEDDGFVCEMIVASTKVSYENALSRGPYDLILSDFRLPDFDGRAALSMAREKWPNIPFILLSGSIGEEQAVECLKDGAVDYVLKEGIGRLVPAVRRAIHEAEAMAEKEAAEQERHRMELQLRQAQKLEAIGQLAAGIAHEINTPTQYIGDNTRFIQDSFNDLKNLLLAYDKLFHGATNKAITPEMVAEVESVRAAADVDYLMEEIPKAIDQTLLGVDRVSRIVHAMKKFSHPGSEEKSRMDINGAIDSTITVARNEWKYVADLSTEFQPDLPLVSCFPGEINQVILNLVVNAAHAIADTPAVKNGGKGRINITTRSESKFVEIRIADSGTGIPEHARPKLFEPFFTTKAVGKGTGQGLFIAHNVVVEKHGGTIRFETEMGRGTTFIIQLPIDSPPASARRNAAA